MRIEEPLKPHQSRAVEKLGRLRVGALYAEPGTGKVRTVLELVRMRTERGKIDCTLWLCACEAVEKTEREICGLTGGDLSGLTVCGIESLSHSMKLFTDLKSMLTGKRAMLVIDGGILVKNHQSVRSVRTRLLSEMCRYRLLVSEIPLTRSVEDMYAQWRMLDWRILGYQSFWSFSVNHLDLEQQEPGKRRPKNILYLARRIEPYTAQLLRSDCCLPMEKNDYIWTFRLPGTVMGYYREVVRAMLQDLGRGNALIYRLVMACQMMVSGRVVTSFYPLRTAPLYKHPMDNPRIRELIQALECFAEERILILCRFSYEVRDVIGALKEIAVPGGFTEYRRGNLLSAGGARIVVMNRMCGAPVEEEVCRPEIILHYSLDWDWGKRRQVENRASETAKKVVSLIALGTIDPRIYESLKFKQNLVRQIYGHLNELLPAEE